MNEETTTTLADGLRPEYDLAELLTGGVQGKYAARYQEDTNLVLLAPDIATHEYRLLIDGVIGLEPDTNEDAFFDGLLDAIIEYAERHNALAVLSLSHHAYDAEEGDENENVNGAEIAEEW